MKKLLIAVLLAGTALAGQAVGQELQDRANALFDPLPESMPGAENDTPAEVALGQKLYFEKKLSVNGTQSCNSCHRLDNNLGGDDGNPVSPGAVKGKFGGRNAPTTINAGFHLAQFWDGRAADLEEQATGPILNPVEMGMPSGDKVVARLKDDADYRRAFDEVFGEAVSMENIARAIAAYERTLISEDRFDDYLNGDTAALNQQEKRGLKTFMDAGCAGCHNGALLGGNSYQKMGVVQAYENTEDKGRMEVTGKESDKYVFKVPSLRNVALTAPYFHDGAVATLEEAVRRMGSLQLGRQLGDDQVADITAFLGALSNKDSRDLAQR